MEEAAFQGDPRNPAPFSPNRGIPASAQAGESGASDRGRHPDGRVDEDLRQAARRQQSAQLGRGMCIRRCILHRHQFRLRSRAKTIQSAIHIGKIPLELTRHHDSLAAVSSALALLSNAVMAWNTIHV